MKITPTLILLVLCFGASSQQQNNLLSTDALRQMGTSSSFAQMSTKKNTDFDIVGTTYYIEGLNPGKIRMVMNKTYIEGVEIRYDIFYDQVEVRANGVFFAADNKSVTDFVIDDGDQKHWFFNSEPYAGNFELGYLRSIYKGEEISVFANDIKREKKNDSSEPYSAIKNTIEYLDDINYYVHSKATAKLVRIKSKKKLIESFPSLSEFGNLSKTNLKNEQFLSKMGNFLEESGK